ncbi:hypothetical protein N752_26725 [Desulforamulus aquiferis]|nr:hypothetical protein N752_26725 [Desulforamulus aquiferis]
MLEDSENNPMEEIMALSVDKSLLRDLPKVDELLQHFRIIELMRDNPRKIVVDSIRSSIDELRCSILDGEYTGTSEEIFDAVLRKSINRIKWSARPNLRRVINGTGVVLHTNLGRALLAESAKTATIGVASNYCNLEMNLESGKRGSRYEPLEELLIQLTGAEAAWW